MNKTQNNAPMEIQPDGTVLVRNGDGGEYWYADETVAYIAGDTWRANGPAMIWSPVGEFWKTKKDLSGLHRDDGPAAIYVSGRQEWWVAGYLHREDGPAVVDSDGSEKWYYFGHRQPEIYNGNECWKYNEYYRVGVMWDHISCMVKRKSPVRTGQKDIFHRLNGPAVTTSKGIQEWFVKGKRHRVGGPAVIVPAGIWGPGPAFQWYVDGVMHRTDGPAFIQADGIEHYALNGKPVSIDEFEQATGTQSSLKKKTSM